MSNSIIDKIKSNKLRILMLTNKEADSIYLGSSDYLELLKHSKLIKEHDENEFGAHSKIYGLRIFRVKEEKHFRVI